MDGTISAEKGKDGRDKADEKGDAGRVAA